MSENCDNNPPCHMLNSPCPFFLTEIWPFPTTWRWCLLWHWHQVHPVHFDIILTHVLTLHYFLLFRTHTTLLNFRWWRKGVLLCTLLFVLMSREPCRLKSDNLAIKSHSTHHLPLKCLHRRITAHILEVDVCLKCINIFFNNSILKIWHKYFYFQNLLLKSSAKI